MEAIETANKCPRCAAAPHPFTVEERGSPSRQTMDGAEPVIVVCPDCREREVFRGSAGLPPIPIERWPVQLAALVEEDTLRLAHYRAEEASEARRAYLRREAARLSP